MPPPPPATHRRDVVTLKNRKSQFGFTLIEMLMVLGIAMTIMASATFYVNQDFQKDTAKLYGLQIAQYTVAVRESLVVSGAAMLAGGSPMLGVSRLQTNNGTCPGGTATQPFLACAYSPTLLYGVNLNALGTVIASNGVAPNPTYSGVTVFPGVTDSAGKVRPDLTGLATQAAMKYDGYDKASSFSGGTVAYQFFPAAGNYTNPATGGLVPVAANSLVAIAVADAGADMFLRVDGTNAMSGALNMNANNIVAANNYTGTGNVTAGGNLAVTGASSLNGFVTMNGALNVGGASVFQNASMTNLTVTGSTDLQGAISNSSSSNGGGVLINDSTSIGTATAQQNFVVSGQMDLTSTTATHTISNNVIAKDMSVSGTLMGGQNISLSGVLMYADILTNNSVLIKPQCNSINAATPQIFVTPVM